MIKLTYLSLRSTMVGMTAGTIIITVLIYILLVILAGFRPKQPAISKFELNRRLKVSNADVGGVKAKFDSVDDALTLVRLFKIILVIGFVYALVSSYDWLLGGALAIVGSFMVEVVARMGVTAKATRKIHSYLERHLFNFAHLYGKYIKFLRGFNFWTLDNPTIHSREELGYIFEHTNFLTNDEQDHLRAALELDTATVESVMKDIKDQVTISQHDLMGPLLLHELHETGEDIFPVTESADNPKIVGVVSISHLLTLEDKTSHKVKYFMNTDFPSFKQGMSIKRCFDKFDESKEFMGIVYGDNKKVQGVVYLQDCLLTVLGQRK